MNVPDVKGNLVRD